MDTDTRLNLVNTGVYTHIFHVPLLVLVNLLVKYKDGKMSLYLSICDFKEWHRVATEDNNGTEEEAQEMIRRYEEILYEGLDKILGR